MANIMVVSGYVKKVDTRQGFMNIQLSVPDGRDQNNQQRYVPVTVHVSFGQNENCYLNLQEGMYVMVQGRYRKYQSNNAWYDQLACYQGDIFVSQRPAQNNQQNTQQNNRGYQRPTAGVDDGNIPF